MKTDIRNIKFYIPIFVLTLFLFAGCSWFSGGTIDDPGEPVGAPTEPEVIHEGFEEGADYPEEEL